MAGVGVEIDFTRIRQAKVRELLKENGLYFLNDLSKLHSLCFNKDDGKKYHKHIKSFIINKDILSVWATYKTISPEQTWNGKMVSFGLMFSRKSKTITFPGDPYHGLEPGQVLFLNLNLFANLAHLAVGHEVTEVNENDKFIKICYLQNGSSIGTQKIHLQEISNSSTKVIHETWYTSGSLFRDKFLYPLFHSSAISEFHNNVKRKAEE